MDFVWNRFALIHPRSEENFLWPNPKPVPSRGLLHEPAKTEMPNKLFTEHCGFGLLDPKTKTTRAELFSKGLCFSLLFNIFSLVVFMILMIACFMQIC